MDLQQLIDVFEIQKLKARYFRLNELEMWEELRDVYTDDFELYVETSSVPQAEEPSIRGADVMIAYLRSAHPDKISIHHGHMPEIDFVDENTATGIWAEFDWVDDPGRETASKRYGHYHDRYVRCPDGKWRIASVRHTVLRANHVPHQPSDREPRVDPRMLDAATQAQRTSS